MHELHRTTPKDGMAHRIGPCGSAGSCGQSTHPPLQLDHIFYPVEWLKQVGYFDRGALSEPHYPAVPLPNHMVKPIAARPVAAVTHQLVDKDEQPIVPSDEQLGAPPVEPPPPHADPWLSTDRVRGLAIGLFTLVILLVAVVCFQVGRWYGGRTGYTEIGGRDDEPYPTGGARHDTVQPYPRVVTTTR
jgi:hypothetical protein